MIDISKQQTQFRNALEDLKLMVMQGSFEIKHLEMACHLARTLGHMEGLRDGEKMFDKAMKEAVRP